MAANKLKITLIRSFYGRKPNQRRTIAALGLKRINQTVVKEARSEILGMIRTVAHLVKVEELKNE